MGILKVKVLHKTFQWGGGGSFEGLKAKLKLFVGSTFLRKIRESNFARLSMDLQLAQNPSPVAQSYDDLPTDSK